MCNGLKENVIVGRLIPAGTGLSHHKDRRRHRDPEAEDAKETATEELTQALKDAFNTSESEAE